MSDTYDLLTLSEGKDALGLTANTTDQDTLVASYITTVSRILDINCGPLVQRTITAEKRSGGNNAIPIHFGPAIAISSITEYQGMTAVTLTAETPGTAPADGYILDAENGLVYRRSSGEDTYFAFGRNNIQITYTTGRYATTSAVDPRVKRAAGTMLRHLWSIDKGSGNLMFGEVDAPTPIGFAIPNRVREMLADLWQIPAVI
jgi:hypothetical protein